MSRKRSHDKKEVRSIAKERIGILLQMAETVHEEDRELSRRYVHLARKIGARHNVRFTKKDKLKLCKKCDSFMVPGKNCRVRTLKTRVIITCLECGAVKRIPFTREKKDKLNKHPQEKQLPTIGE